MMAKSKSSKEKGDRVTPRSTVMFKWNDKSPFHSAGDESQLHPIQAGKMEKKGFGKIIAESQEDTSSKGQEQDVSAGGSQKEQI